MCSAFGVIGSVFRASSSGVRGNRRKLFLGRSIERQSTRTGDNNIRRETGQVYDYKEQENQPRDNVMNTKFMELHS